MNLELLGNYLKRNKFEASFFTHNDPTLVYLIGFKPTFGFLMISTQEVRLFISNLDKNPTLNNISVQYLSKGWGKKLQNSKIRKVGINKSCLTVRFYEKLKKIYPYASFVDISEQLGRLRMKKTSSEIKKIKKASQIMDKSFSELLKHIREFKTEQDIASFLEQKIREQGVELAFPPIIASGKNSAIPHHQSSNKRLNPGFLLVDFGAKYQNYCADMTRMLYLGKPTKPEQEIYDFLLKVQQEAIKQVKANKSFSDLNRFVMKELGQYSPHFIHSLGHGVGLEVHEAPKISIESKDRVLKNCIFTIEPGIYFPGKFGIRIEDTVLFDGNVKVLTKSSKKLVQIRFN